MGVMYSLPKHTPRPGVYAAPRKSQLEQGRVLGGAATMGRVRLYLRRAARLNIERAGRAKCNDFHRMVVAQRSIAYTARCRGSETRNLIARGRWRTMWQPFGSF
jgi:hypothetical protein